MRTVVKLSVVLMGMIIGALLFALPALNGISSAGGKKEVIINNQIIIAEVASTPEAQSQGLSGRDSLDFNQGMLFLFDGLDKYGFWMKGMKIPIDIVWIRNDRIVGVEENVPPPTDPNSLAELKIYRPPLAVDKVLEVAAGRAKSFGANIGDQVIIKPYLQRMAKKG
jgi:uncharacterized protein